MKLPSGQLSFEEVQQLLLDRGLKDLATNLRAELDKGLCLSSLIHLVEDSYISDRA